MRLIYALGLLLLSGLLYAQLGDKLYVAHQSYKSTDGSASAEIFFIQDRETGTRCYAFRGQANDGAAIACVKQ